MEEQGLSGLPEVISRWVAGCGGPESIHSTQYTTLSFLISSWPSNPVRTSSWWSQLQFLKRKSYILLQRNRPNKSMDILSQKPSPAFFPRDHTTQSHNSCCLRMDLGATISTGGQPAVFCRIHSCHLHSCPSFPHQADLCSEASLHTRPTLWVPKCTFKAYALRQTPEHTGCEEFNFTCKWCRIELWYSFPLSSTYI